MDAVMVIDMEKAHLTDHHEEPSRLVGVRSDATTRQLVHRRTLLAVDGRWCCWQHPAWFLPVVVATRGLLSVLLALNVRAGEAP